MGSTPISRTNGPVAQMVEQKPEELRVGGSIPSWPAIRQYMKQIVLLNYVWM